MITIYGNELSNNSNKVRFVANALKTDYEFKTVNVLAGENKKPEFLKLNPVGKIPVLQDGDFVLFESNAISKYLAQKASSSLYPTDPKSRATVDQWMDFSSIHIGTAMGRVLFNRVLYKVFGGQKDEQSLKDGLGFLDRFLPVLEQQLGKEKYLTGPHMTLADICLLAVLDPAELASVSFDSYPRLKKWQKELQAQEFYQKLFSSYTQMVMSKMGSGT